VAVEIVSYGPKTRSAASQGQPRVASPSETSELEPASAPETPRITQETPNSWTRRRIPPACQPFMTDASEAAVMTAWFDRAGEVGHCWLIQTAREISRKRNGSRHFDIGSSHYRRRQGLSPAVSDRSSFRAIRAGPRETSTVVGLMLKLTNRGGVTSD
jgi:hypothetical protein